MSGKKLSREMMRKSGRRLKRLIRKRRGPYLNSIHILKLKLSNLRINPSPTGKTVPNSSDFFEVITSRTRAGALKLAGSVAKTRIRAFSFRCSSSFPRLVFPIRQYYPMKQLGGALLDAAGTAMGFFTGGSKEATIDLEAIKRIEKTANSIYFMKWVLLGIILLLAIIIIMFAIFASYRQKRESRSVSMQPYNLQFKRYT